MTTSNRHAAASGAAQKKQAKAHASADQKPEGNRRRSLPSNPCRRSPTPKPGDDKKEEHYDMAEVAPVVTHHQITVDGKTF